MRYYIRMRIVEINSISKAESYIYYINRYKGTAVMEFLEKQISFPFSFAIEVSPLGKKTISLEDIPRNIDYPLLPIIKGLKVAILELEKKDKLP